MTVRSLPLMNVLAASGFEVMSVRGTREPGIDGGGEPGRRTPASPMRWGWFT